MQISTLYNDRLLTGVVRKHSSYFLEVAITSPISGYITSRSVPWFARNHIRYEGETFEQKSRELLIELYQVANHSISR